MIDPKQNIRRYFLKEEAPTVSAGTGAVAGIGVGPDGEPGVTPASAKKYKYSNNIMDYLLDKDEEEDEDPIELKRSDKFHNLTQADQQKLIMMKMTRR